LGAIEALRWSSVLTSLLGVWFAWLLARRVFPGQVAVA
jgi:ABC-type sulfate transport system permease component